MRQRVEKDERQKRLADTQECWKKFVDKFFVAKENFLFPGRNEGGRIFSKDAIASAIEALAGAGEGKFNEIAPVAFARAPDSVKYLFSHAVFVYELIITDHKVKKVEVKERDINCLNLDGFAGKEKIYLKGCSSIGNYLMIYKKPAIEYVLRLFEHLAEQPAIASASGFSQAIKLFCEGEYKAQKGGIAGSMSSMILWYVAPDEYEPISAQREKEAIASHFAHLIKGDPGYSDDMLADNFNVNKALRMIRQKLEAERGEKISFYDADVEAQWKVRKNEKGFRKWLEDKGYSKGLRGTAYSYSNALKNPVSDFAKEFYPDLLDGNTIFDMSDKNDFDVLKEALKADEKFKELDNRAGNKTKSNALERYGEYLADKEGGPKIGVLPYNKGAQENEGSAMTKEILLNQIFYGPPGTGKTYGVVEAALSIIDGKNLGGRQDRGEQMERFKSLQEAKRIAMVTFHQNFAYEDFIEGIKPKLTDDSLSYFLDNGVFKRMALIASGRRLVFRSVNLGKDTDEVLQAIMNYNFYQMPRSEQLSMTIGEVLLNWDSPAMAEAIRELHRIYRIKVLSKRVLRISAESLGIDEIFKGTKYASSWYEELKIHPSVLGDGKNQSTTISRPKELGGGATRKYIKIKIDLEKMLLAENSHEEKGEASKKPYVLIIDEINRGNVSAIFGELITLLEEDKRLGRENALRLTLPYSKEPFGVPDNLHIIGTMNTADRSIALLDTALRRRFHFVEMMPDPQKATDTSDISGIDCGELLEAINKKIRFWYDREHQIGHAYLMNLQRIEELKAAFQQKIIPLLQEYFFDDWEKIDLVLNKNGFIEKNLTEINGEEKTLYSKLPFGDEAWDKAENYREIYKKKNLQADDE